MKKNYVLLALLFPLGIVFFMNWFVQRTTYPAPAIRVGPPPSTMKLVSVPYAHGNLVTGWIQEKESSRTALLYLHGNGENLETIRHSGLLEQLQDLNISFLVIDYPGYGNSEGKPSEESLLKSAEGAIDTLSKRFLEQRIVVCGWSLGASVAILTAAKNKKVHGLIAMSAWTSLTNVALLHFPSWMVKAMPAEKYDSLKASKSVRSPSLLIHGEQDPLIPVQQGEQIASNLPNLQQWLKVPQAGHNDLLNFPEVWTSISSFLRKLESD